MGTYYKPTQRRGKRVVYRSTDPSESRRETVKLLQFLIAAGIGMAAVLFLSWWK